MTNCFFFFFNNLFIITQDLVSFGLLIQKLNNIKKKELNEHNVHAFLKKFKNGTLSAFNPLTPMSDQDRISPYYIFTISSRQVMRIKKNINKGNIR